MKKLISRDSGPKTFTRGLKIIDVLYQAGIQGLKIADIAALTNIHRPTVYRFLDALIEQSFALETSAPRRFVFNYGRFRASPDDGLMIERLKPVLKRISTITGNSSFLVRRDDAISLCVHRELGSYPIQVLTVTIGHRQPLGVGAAGLALLSSLKQDDIESILSINKDVLPKYGGMTVERMRQLIKSSQERGWSVVGNAAVPGVLGVGVAVQRPVGQPNLAVSVSSILERMPLEKQRSIIDLIRAELNKIDH